MGIGRRADDGDAVRAKERAKIGHRALDAGRRAAGDDAAQDLAGAALDRQLGGDQRGVAQRLLEAVVVAVGRRVAGGGANRRTLSGKACSQLVPRSLTTAASTAGVLPACSMPATDNDMRLQRRQMRDLAADALGEPLARLGAGDAHQFDQAGKVSSQRSGPLRS